MDRQEREKESDPPALPRSLPAWFSFLWSQVLFCGSPRPAESWRWSSLLLLLVVPGALLYPCLSFFLFEPDEGRYAQIPREMLEKGEWLIPLLQGKPYLDKPPLFYWLVMGSYALLGIHDWAARLVPALAVHGSILMTYLLGRRSLGERSARWGALALALSPAFMGMGRLLVLDGVLSFWVVLSLLAAFEAVRGPGLVRGWWLLSAVACGLGILTKGPVALILLVIPLWLYGRLTGTGCRPGRWALLAFCAVVLALILPWYVGVCLHLPEFAGHFLWEHNVVRFLMPFDHGRPIWFYGPILLLGLLPATLLLGPFLYFLGTGREEVARLRTPELGFMLLAGGWCLLFFTLSGCKLPPYILPGFPFLALALGHYLAHSRWQSSRLTGAVAGLAFALLLVAHYLVVPYVARVRSPMNRPEEVLATCSDQNVPVVCYPRPLDSVAFYLGRNDFLYFRSKETPTLLQFLQDRPATVVLFSHRHSLHTLKEVLPPHLYLAKTGPLGLCDMAVVKKK